MAEQILGANEGEQRTNKTAHPEMDEEARQKLIEEGKAAAILGYIPFMCFVPLVKMRDNPFAVRHGKQGLILFIIEIIAAIFLLPQINYLFWGLVIILCLASGAAGIYFALQGQDWKIPFIGDLADKMKI
jgi:fumarate reductase subunit D